MIKKLLLFVSFAALSVAGAQAKPTQDVEVPTLSTEILQNGGSAQNDALRDFMNSVPENREELKGKRIAMLTTDGVEEIELLAPIKFLEDRGASVDVVAPRFEPLPAHLGVLYPEKRATHILTVKYFEYASWIEIDRFLDEVTSSDYDAVIIPGGAWNPDNLRVDARALDFIKALHAEGKPVAAICHGPLVLVNAGLLQGRRATTYWNVMKDLENAGAQVVDEPVVVDGNVITSRFPLDLPPFINALKSAL